MAADASPVAVLERLRDAINAHDLDGLVDCFADDYDSEQPAHPERAFRGDEQVRENWSQMLGGVPDLRAEILGSVVDGDVVWAEWVWRGTRADGVPFEMRGVTVTGVADGRLSWARLYMEPVERVAPDVGTAIRRDLLGRDRG